MLHKKKNMQKNKDQDYSRFLMENYANKKTIKQYL